MRKVNLIVGLLLLLLFILSGQYMKHVFLPENTDELVMRMQIRASHIYIPFLAALNVLAVGVPKADRESKLHRVLELIFGITLIASAVFALLSFWHEHTGDIHDRGFTKWMVIMMLVGMGAYVLSKIFKIGQSKT